MPSRSRTIYDGQGRPVGMACERVPHRKCSTPGCSNHADIQCDFPVKRKGKPGTCDRWCCRSCATRVGPNKDYCPPHQRASSETK